MFYGVRASACLHVSFLPRRIALGRIGRGPNGRSSFDPFCPEIWGPLRYLQQHPNRPCLSAQSEVLVFWVFLFFFRSGVTVAESPPRYSWNVLLFTNQRGFSNTLLVVVTVFCTFGLKHFCFWALFFGFCFVEVFGCFDFFFPHLGPIIENMFFTPTVDLSWQIRSISEVGGGTRIFRVFYSTRLLGWVWTTIQTVHNRSQRKVKNCSRWMICS